MFRFSDEEQQRKRQNSTHYRCVCHVSSILKNELVTCQCYKHSKPVSSICDMSMKCHPISTNQQLHPKLHQLQPLLYCVQTTETTHSDKLLHTYSSSTSHHILYECVISLIRIVCCHVYRKPIYRSQR